MMNQNPGGANVETRLRIMRILWIVFLITIGLFAMIAYFTGPDWDGEGPLGDGFPMLYIFFAVALSLVVASFPVKQSFFKKAEREQRVEQVQMGLILALVLCEVAAQLGLMAVFLVGDRNAYLLFVLAALGQLLHFPRREPLLAASHKRAV